MFWTLNTALKIRLFRLHVYTFEFDFELSQAHTHKYTHTHKHTHTHTHTHTNTHTGPSWQQTTSLTLWKAVTLWQSWQSRAVRSFQTTHAWSRTAIGCTSLLVGRVGQNHIYTVIYVIFGRYITSIWSCTVYLYGSGQLYWWVYW